MRLQPILDQIAEAVTSLLRSEYSLIHLAEGELLHFQAHAGVPAAAVEYERSHPIGPGFETLTGRVALTKQPVHIRDVAADADYNFPAVKLAPVRTMLGAPVLHGSFRQRSRRWKSMSRRNQASNCR
jgi:GAF domain